MFERAEKLGMTVAQMEREMDYQELLEWMALDTIRNREREKAQRLASKGMNVKRPGRR